MTAETRNLHSWQHPPLPTAPGHTLHWRGLHDTAPALALARAIAAHPSLFLVVTPDSHSAQRLEQALAFFLGERAPVLHFPDWETLPYDVFSPLPEIISERLRTLVRLPKTRHGVLVTPIATLMQRLAPQHHILARSLSLETGERLDLAALRERLEQAGYQCVPQVQQHGEFAVRGAILDLFPMGSDTPLRIELFDDEIESIRTFDPETQRTIARTERFELFPAREFPTDSEAVKRFRRAFRNAFPDLPAGNPLYQDVSSGFFPAGIEAYLPLFLETTATLFDYLPKDTTLVLAASPARASEFFTEVEQRYQLRRGDLDRPPLPPETLYLPPEDLRRRFQTYPRIDLFPESEAVDKVDFATAPLPDVALEPQKKEPATRLQAFLAEHEGPVLFTAESPGRREALLDILKQSGLRPESVADWADFLARTPPLALTLAPLEQGLWSEDPALAVIPEARLYGERARQRRRDTARDIENLIADLSELTVGAPVVHRDHGVGRYLGLQRLEAGGVETEFLTLEYAGGDKLYVPVANLHLISRYSGADVENAPLHKLGGEQWKKARKKAQERVRDVAAELLEIHARRAARQGFAHQLDEAGYRAFAAAFPFEETPDQRAAIEAVLADLKSPRPMDRVVCGDVGFGKTEVAMRAAFVAVQSGKQVAVLVPTTLLAQQHYQNFRDRFADWPVRVEALSRFVTPTQQKQILRDVTDGKVDILIGTHKLLQKSVKYKNLGLVIIDEEQRFGVRQKEHFKKLRSEVDLLTLTATPIPRTLNMSLSGLRDISIIASPPEGRHPIQTFVSEWVDGLVQEAILREIRRGGQVYFVHNKIESMARIAEEIGRLVPEARIRIAHGQMPERELERIMLDFYHQRFNVLLCTTIIESGIDVPSANTIIIHRADLFGLAQLHQLRGRVGRSHHRAYAYLLVPPKKLMTKDAVKRLEAIQASGDLGAGFLISSHDLEIRGAGELLGDEQSGQIQEIGFNLYTEMLEKAVKALREGRELSFEEEADNVEVDLKLPALIPDDYVPDVHTRLVLYKRIANAETGEALEALQVEMIDRFGLLPQAAKNLFTVAELKQRAERLGVTKIDANAKGGRIQFTAEPSIDVEALLGLVQSRPQTYRLDGPQTLRFEENLEEPARRLAFVTELLAELAPKSA
ncbi:transcription-repair coupling factor [Methylomarinovum tepidoasis]|uniref:Transcription-repair-coupling factor n=1 Tax=Methylomarinovum tepidoasis TaxID=2840183 RepID=A0AAU9C9P5_9GAMM|nr:transcription-repair coupling factor [Methylomarinovum sp. IN45]BCX88601.1 transcription-repair coupling factor [Methylomarinovum sp. IN45]